MRSFTKHKSPIWHRFDIGLGVFGLLLPWLVWILGKAIYQLPLQPSLSDYYHTPIGWFHAIGLVLFAFYFLVRPWGTKRGRLLGSMIAAFTVLTVVFPAPACIQAANRFTRSSEISGQLHLLFAALLFFTLTFMTFRFFSEAPNISDNKKLQNPGNSISKWFGSVMLICSAFIVGISIFGDTCNTPTKSNTSIFWFEFLALSCFWCAWLLHHKPVGKLK